MVSVPYYISVTDYGIVGDGSTINVLNGSALETAIINAAASPGNPLRVYFPPGIYKMSGPLPNVAYVTYCGDAPGQLWASVNSGGATLSWVNGSMLNCAGFAFWGMKFENLRLEGATGAWYLVDINHLNVTTTAALSGSVTSVPVSATGVALNRGASFIVGSQRFIVSQFTPGGATSIPVSSASVSGTIASGSTAYTDLNSLGSSAFRDVSINMPWNYGFLFQTQSPFVGNNTFDLDFQNVSLIRYGQTQTPAINITTTGGTSNLRFRGGTWDSNGCGNAPMVKIVVNSGADGQFSFENITGEWNTSGMLDIEGATGVEVKNVIDFDAATVPGQSYNYTGHLFYFLNWLFPIRGVAVV